MRPTTISALALPLLCSISASVGAQTLETETARLMPAHAFEAAGNLEYQFSADGRETALPLAFAYGLARTWELVVEPVPFTAIHPAAALGTSGIGDIEITVVHRWLDETAGRPAFAFAGELKVPTAESRLIGTDKTDYSAYLIASKRIRRVDFHANLGYTFFGQPAGLVVRNVVDFAFAAMWDAGDRTKLFAEVVGNTAASSSGDGNPAAPEVSGSEVAGTVGIGRVMSRTLFVSLGMSVDNNRAILLRPAFTLRVH